VTSDDLAQLLDAHANALQLFAAQWSEAPADVVQEAFVELARQPESPQKVVAWLYRVVRNRAVSEARSATRRKRRESIVASAAVEWFRLTAETDFDAREAADALQELQQEIREVIVARIWGGLTFEQIAEVTATSTSTAYRRYEEGLSLLRKRLGLPCPNEKTTHRA
jgi:RNA polymerase sigma-70 factor (ECF subfamily)